MNKPKVLVVITDKRTLQETIYKDVEYFSVERENYQITEFIITDRHGARHHFPKEHYDYELYQEQVNSNPGSSLNHYDEENLDYVSRMLKSRDGRVVTPRDRLFLEGRI
mgnify:FL=1|jgi:hypothetical protein